VVREVDPQIPPSFADENLPTTFRALFDIHADGTATVSLVKSTGDSQLDQIALDAAKQWTFRPGTLNGKPIDSYLRLKIDFVPSS
jgi:protein TonB